MANKRIKDLATTITSFRTGDVILVDGPSGTAKMPKDDLLKETAENAVDSGVAASRKELYEGFEQTESVTNGQSATFDIAFFKGQRVNFTLTGTGFSITIYGYANGSWSTQLTPDTYTTAGDYSFTLSASYEKLRFYSSVNATYTCKVTILSFVNDDTLIKNSVAKIDRVLDSSEWIYGSIVGNSADVNISIKKGDLVEYEVTLNEQVSYDLTTYLRKTDNTFVKGIMTNYVGDRVLFVADQDYNLVRFYSPVSVSHAGRARIVGSIDRRNEFEYLRAVRPLKILILGDSYSANSVYYRDYLTKYLPQGSSIICLAVNSASVKDKYQDRTTYPYTSRPVSNENSGNLNTLGCQIAKLDRLMEGTDLDPTESQIYASPSDYPDLVIVEGGMNDRNDDNTDNYFAQFETDVSYGYRKQTSASAVTRGTCSYLPDVNSVDRTCFAGAYRYIFESIVKRFPKAQIMAITCCNLGYWDASVVKRRYLTAEQQRFIFRLCSIPFVDWQAESNCSCLRNYPIGTGTSDAPVVWGEGNGEDWCDTNDAMHPGKDSGKKRMAQSVAVAIWRKFFLFDS